MAEESGEGLAAILAQLARHYRVDFRNYRRAPSAAHDAARRLVSVWLAAYRAYLEENPNEVDELYRDLLIGVTSFFPSPRGVGAAAAPFLVGRRAGRGSGRACLVRRLCNWRGGLWSGHALRRAAGWRRPAAQALCLRRQRHRPGDRAAVSTPPASRAKSRRRGCSVLAGRRRLRSRAVVAQHGDVHGHDASRIRRLPAWISSAAV